jgi:GT2 family glycosyltransferase
MELSVLTPVRDRTEHLANLVAGLGRADAAGSFELLVGWMSGDDPRPALGRARGFEARAIEIDGEELPLARARNELAGAASGAVLVFLDVDCVPSAGLLTAYARALREHDALAIGETRYLPRGFRADGADERSLRRAARAHPDRVGLFPASGEVRIGGEHELFWSLSFAVRRETFLERIGGFDESYRGYGIEDTDFAMRPRGPGCRSPGSAARSPSTSTTRPPGCGRRASRRWSRTSAATARTGATGPPRVGSRSSPRRG